MGLGELLYQAIGFGAALVIGLVVVVGGITAIKSAFNRE